MSIVMFIGYAENNVAYRFLVIKSDNNLSEVNTIIEIKNANFFRALFPMKTNGEDQIHKSILYESNEHSEIELRNK